MTLERVIFQINNKNFYKFFDRSKIKIGKVFFIKESETGDDIQISETEFENSKRVAVNWIAPSEWAVSLLEKYHLESSEITKIQNLLQGYLPSEEVENKLKHFASKLRIEHLYKSSEYDNSILRVIFAVGERLELISNLKSKEIGEKIWHQWEPIISYHLLTCFDLLGQPSDWKTFDSWLISDSNENERREIISKIDKKANEVEISLHLYQEYLKIYGVKNSFFRFIKEVLPKENELQLLKSIKIHTNSMPPTIKTISEDGTDEEKEIFLFGIRNNYTHKVKIIPGINNEIMNMPEEFRKIPTVKFQEFKAEKWSTYLTQDWPYILEHIVKIGLSEYIRRQN